MLEYGACSGIRGCPMRGRKPRPLTIAADDLPVLQAVARSRHLPWFQVQHARIVLAVAAGELVHAVASRMECDRATVWRLCRRYEQGGLTRLLWDEPRLGRPQEISPVQRAQIVELACLEPIAGGLHITHWTSQDLARQAVADGLIESISPRTVRQILHDVDLQPHRTRYWKTARLDAQFKERAEKVLWCYGNAERLARRGLWAVAVDEIPNFQVLERRPIRRAVPGFIEQQEFEYIRHGTVNLLLFLIVHTGRMEVAVEVEKDAEHYVRELRTFRRRHRGLERGVLDPRRRPEPYGRGDVGILVELRGLVAAPLHAGPRLLAEPGRAVGRSVRVPLPEASVLGQSGGVHRACVGLRV